MAQGTTFDQIRLAPMLFLLLIAFLVSKPHPVSAEDVQPPFGHPLWPIPRYLSLSTNSSTAARLRSDPEQRAAAQRGFQMLQALVNLFDERLENSDSPCNLHGSTEWVEFAPDAAIKRQIPHQSFDKTCPMQIVMTEAVEAQELPETLQRNALAIISDFVNATWKAISSIDDNPVKRGVQKWAGNYAQSNWSLAKGSQRCSLQTFSAYRVNNRLYARASMTNHPVEKNVPDYQRMYVEEWVRDDLNNSLAMIQPRLIVDDDGQIARGPWERSTTLFSRWANRNPVASHTMQRDDNPAWIEALRLNDLNIQQADDSLVPSNVAILVLPLVMTVVPGTFFGGSSTLSILLYMLFTDVLSVLPFLIKGVELTQAGKGGTVETVAYHLGNGTFGEIEVWSVSCVGKSQFKKIGIIFITIALVSIVIGVTLEIVAVRLLRSRRARIAKGKKHAEIEDSFGLLDKERQRYHRYSDSVV